MRWEASNYKLAMRWDFIFGNGVSTVQNPIGATTQQCLTFSEETNATDGMQSLRKSLQQR